MDRRCTDYGLQQCLHCRVIISYYVGIISYYVGKTGSKECFIEYWRKHFPRIPMNIIKKKYLTNIYLQKAVETYYPDMFQEISKLLILL